MADLACDVHYRTTPSFNDQLGHRAAEWNVSTNEAARRLAALAHFQLTLGDHARVVELADTMSVGFVQAATALNALGNGKSFSDPVVEFPTSTAGGFPTTKGRTQ